MVAGASPKAAGSTVTGPVTSPPATTQTVEVVVVVSSSRPSSPRNTQASAPRAANTPAITGTIRRSAQPIACAAGRTGLASGPRKLKVVPMPSSRRGTAVWRIAGLKAAAKQKVMPASTATRGDPVGRQVEPDAERLEHVGAARPATTPSGCRA